MSDSHRPTICAGFLRGRRLDVPPGRGVRPTRSLVRQALFNMLAGDVPDARVLDLYSGSGALGLEALSRGARNVVFVEQGRAALAALRGNIERCQLEPGLVRVSTGDVLAFEPFASECFDLIQLDPPFARQVAVPESLERPGVLSPDAVLAWHAPSERAAPVLGPGWELDRSRVHGRSTLHIFCRSG
jgi:16S rRNA (guanine966-N2)-methyltransferase